MFHRNHISVFLILFLCTVSTFAQYRNPDYIRYIKQYSLIASEQQKKYKIPASITLAQGLLESGGGKGRLAREANNHFGIKCHEWDGKKIYHDDDRRNDCFRKYSLAEDSFHDHSLFLTKRERYASLFLLRPTDYKGWARGLQRCGYATDRAYANKLIKLIEDYELYKYDQKQFVRPVRNSKLPAWYRPHVIYKSNDLLYVIARDNETFDMIANELDFRSKRLRSYNEVPRDYPLSQGDVVYLQKKNRKADKEHRYHVVEVGESMHSISQLYGIRIKYLYKMNHKSEDYVPQEGDLIRLR